eukprot:1139844-Pelagomonas_calceolata.AAC.3
MKIGECLEFPLFALVVHTRRATSWHSLTRVTICSAKSSTTCLAGSPQRWVSLVFCLARVLSMEEKWERAVLCIVFRGTVQLSHVRWFDGAGNLCQQYSRRFGIDSLQCDLGLNVMAAGWSMGYVPVKGAKCGVHVFKQDGSAGLGGEEEDRYVRGVELDSDQSAFCTVMKGDLCGLGGYGNALFNTEDSA